MKTYYEFITDYLEELKEDEILDLWNEYCLEEYMDNRVYYNDEYFLDEMFTSTDDAVRAVCYGDYRYRDEYVTVNGYGNLESFDGWKLKDYIYMPELASYLEDTGVLEDRYLDYVEENQEEEI